MNNKSVNNITKFSSDEFLTHFAHIYEHSPWVAKTVWEKARLVNPESLHKLAKLFAESVDQADKDKKLKLIRAHPQLALDVKKTNLTKSSKNEQKSAGLNRCTEQELNYFNEYNNAYKSKFKFPFVVAVKGKNVKQILQAFKIRLENDYETEFNQAIEEIHKIANFRLVELFEKSTFNLDKNYER